jgi:hypothetical protein
MTTAGHGLWTRRNPAVSKQDRFYKWFCAAVASRRRRAAEPDIRIVQRDVQPQNIHAGIAQKAQIRPVGVLSISALT